MSMTNPIRFFVYAVCFISMFCWSIAARCADPPGPAQKYTTVAEDAGALRVHFLDVGAGDAILVETPGPNGKHIFIDGGKKAWTKVIRPYLDHFVGSHQIDLAFVTHPDFDHYDGMVKVFEKYDVLEYWDTGYDSPQLGATWRELQQLVGQESEDVDCAVYSPLSGYNDPGDVETIDDAGTPNDSEDDLRVIFLNTEGEPPFRDPDSDRRFNESERRNNASLVVKLIYGDTSFLLTGDINGRNKKHIGTSFDEECDSVEKFLVDLSSSSAPATHEFLRATVLKAPHHGSNGSNSLSFIEAVNPMWIVLSAGHEYNHPAPDTLRRYSVFGINSANILRTDTGDSTPETSAKVDPIGDDSLVFECDMNGIVRITRLKM